ncbi:hypothetical protein [Paludisphaera borealis]|uniref:Uncharacterized protein n=1 Tax=Paludisphaera borealis TaxID=1387353 RepID=A0A1U7CRG5_9BACT|nr:hypothetical protein [Paludisphaera borealis]APW61537.1 hypothetical protein BSF38_03053 [Paludisphaera borealis]
MSTPEPPSLAPVDSLILARLLVAGDKGAKSADLRKDLAPLLGRRWSGSALTSVVDRAVVKLGASGLIVQSPGKTKRAAPTIALTDSGRPAALAFLNVSELPAKPKPTWAAVKKSLVAARALNLPAPASSFAKDDGLRAVLLNRQSALGLGAYPTLKQAKEAWTRKQLGMGDKEKVTLETVQAALFRRALGDDPRPPAPKLALDRLLSKNAGADGAGLTVKELRDEVVRRWVDDSLGGAAPQPTPAPSAALDLDDFARRVQAAARGCKTGRYGEGKVFIVHVWRALQADPAFHGGDFPAFKARLAEANNARLLNLARADLVQAMDPEDVLLSEVVYMTASFHFIRIEPS